MKSIVIA